MGAAVGMRGPAAHTRPSGNCAVTTHPAKTAAKALRARLTAHGLNALGQQRALNVIAALHGTNWNTLSAQPTLPRLRPPGDALALRRALHTYGVDVTLAWAQTTTAALLSREDALPAPVVSLDAAPEPQTTLTDRPPDQPLLNRGDWYVARPRSRYTADVVHVDRRARQTTPWPLLPLPEQVSPDLRRQLADAHTLEWTPGVGLHIDGRPPVSPIPTLGPDAEVRAWVSALRQAAPADCVDYEVDSSDDRWPLKRVTVTRPTAIPACLTYRAQHPYTRDLLRDARRMLTLSYGEAVITAHRAPRYDAFITAYGLDGRGYAAVSRRQYTHMAALEDAVLQTFPGRRPRIMDHMNHWPVQGTSQVVLTYEPYLRSLYPAVEAEVDAFRKAGWRVELRDSAYAPGNVMVMLFVPHR